MSAVYDVYIREHKEYVVKAFHWLKENVPHVVGDMTTFEEGEYSHDESKYSPEEYDAYDAYFYGNNRSFKVVDDFRRAWLHHIHNNTHHWQHWVLINDDPKEGTVALAMPHINVVEMISDWWAFSHKSGNLYEIFDWYEKHKSYMILHDSTRREVEHILDEIKKVLDSNN